MQLAVIQACAKNDRKAQRQVFEAYGKRLFAIAYRYLGERMAAEDMVAESFTKIFAHVQQAHFENLAAFEAWIKRITINESLTWLRKNQKIQWVALESIDLPIQVDMDPSDWSLQELLQLINQLPVGYRTVMNLFALEGYSHQEIAAMMDISEGTSKSQLSKARVLLKNKMNQLKEHEYQSNI
ncbi:MAG TPA: RNA polymerase sigma factor [Saprospiraceae bacterium]|nr:RNA polymerase sigma factor [Saprospiraceae bacterium]HMQ82720.1 RNA polymerase sigma factor [Saprospiraceae bacterium]